MTTIDLRSDTVTRPSAAMRAAMAAADVGDDVYGEDPTLNRLGLEVAALLGKEAALFVPSGVMANQIALWLHARPGDEVLVSRGAHCLYYESAAAAALSGLQLTEIGDDDGRISAAALEAAVRPNNAHYPVSAALALENTHNRAGGRVQAPRDFAEVLAAARAHKLGTHLDGARLWNAAAALGVPERELAAPFDTVAVCLSKGLGAPVGSLLAGTAAYIERARRRRKVLGGGMRQAGILGAAGLYALAHNRVRLVDDHRRARLLAARWAELPGVHLGPVESNIVVFDLLPNATLDAAAVVTAARSVGVLLNTMGPRRVRAVTHLDVDDTACALAAARLAELWPTLVR